MSMLGERTWPLLTRADGERVNGHWVDGAETETTIRASIQPAKKDDYDQLQALLEGRSVESVVRVYTRTQLKMAGAGLANGDIVIYNSERYLVTAASNWQMQMGGGIDHYRYLAVRQPAAEEGA